MYDVAALMTEVFSQGQYPELMALCSGDRDTAVRLITSFVSSTAADLVAMDQAIVRMDVGALRSLAHRTGSGCRQLDEERAVEALQKVEEWMPGGGKGELHIAVLFRHARIELSLALGRASRFI